MSCSESTLNIINSERVRRQHILTYRQPMYVPVTFMLLIIFLLCWWGSLRRWITNNPKMCGYVVDVWAGCNPSSIIIFTSSWLCHSDPCVMLPFFLTGEVALGGRSLISGTNSPENTISKEARAYECCFTLLINSCPVHDLLEEVIC